MRELKEIKFTKRVNVGNYEHEELTVVVAISEGEDECKAVKATIAFVTSRGEIPLNYLDKATPCGKAESVVGLTKETPSTVSLAPVANTEETVIVKQTKAKKVAAVAIETPAVLPEEIGDNSTPMEVEPDKEKITPVKAKSTARSKATTYDRENDLHKKLIGEILDSTAPGWRIKKGGAAKAASLAMVGKDFMDNSGTILPSFIEEFGELMNPGESLI
jgi:hypothetical protein